ncbi:hypothetical protein VM1G_02640 [Cytospora mali]|uniref:Zn(2)-C6 fungal-type domain-containing protein n=1 Tax=Cytospora mali TaxID=578113 RepID=A0A194VV22_CYTMA|nr:hypothetical protein VM1G_02640 [Valsa mali]
MGKERLDKAIELPLSAEKGHLLDGAARAALPGPGKTTALQNRLASLGRQHGIVFSFAGRIGNTRDAHRLIAMSRTKGPEAQDRSPRRYSATGASEKAGLEPSEVRGWLEGGDGGEEVDAEVREAVERNATGVPSFMIQGKYEVDGAQDEQAFMGAFPFHQGYPRGKDISSAAQSRRFACDRCHRQKLRCERSPIIANGNIVVTLGECSRCVKVNLPCQTTTGASTDDTIGVTKSKTKRNKKRKTPPTEGERDARSPPTFMSLTDIDLHDVSPCNISMFDTNTLSLLDIEHFNFGTGDPHNAADRTCSESLSSAVLNTTLPKGPPESDQEGSAKESFGSQLDDFVALAYFGNPMPQSGGGSNIPLPTPTNRTQNVTTQAHLARSRDDRRERLLELHSLLLNELHCITDADLAQALFSSEGITPPSFDAHMSEANILHRVLFASERLIELLESFRLPVTTQHEPGSRGGHPSWLPTGASDPVARSLESRRVPRLPSSSSSSSSLAPASNATGDSTTATSDPARSCPSTSSFVELPVMISFLSCYVGLLSVYRTILTHIHEALRSAVYESSSLPHFSYLQGRSKYGAPTASRGPGTEPETEKGTRKGGTGRGLLAQLNPPRLSSQHVLRIRIQLEIMTHMLDRIEDAWAGVVGDGDDQQPAPNTTAELLRGHHFQHRARGLQHRESGAGSRVLFRRAATMELLQIMLVHEGMGVSGKNFTAWERCRMEALFEAGLTNPEIARVIKCNERTVRKNRRKWDARGCLEPLRSPQAGRMKITPYHEEAIKEFLTLKPDSALSEVREFLSRKHRVTVDVSTVGKHLKRIGWSRERKRRYASQTKHSTCSRSASEAR